MEEDPGVNMGSGEIELCMEESVWDPGRLRTTIGEEKSCPSQKEKKEKKGDKGKAGKEGGER